jgi:tRNA modification GTPase
LEEYVNVNGIPLKLVDTAGIRETDDIVEKIGVERSREALKGAELILYVMNNNEELTPEDIELLESVDDKKVIGIVNKLDLDNKLDLNYLEEHFKIPLIKTSIINGEGVDELEDEIQKMFFDGSLSSTDSTYVSNNRHINLLELAKVSIEDAISSAAMDVPVDIIQIDLIKTWELLGEVIGEDVSEQLIDKLFSQFCLGK